MPRRRPRRGDRPRGGDQPVDGPPRPLRLCHQGRRLPARRHPRRPRRFRSRGPDGRTLVTLIALGLFAYALWLFPEAALDPGRKGTDAEGAATRVGSAALGCSYAALGVVAAKLALQRGGGESSDQATRDWTARLLARPFGAALVVLIGLAVLGAAGSFFWQAATARFRDDLDLAGAGAAARGWVVPLGRAGHAALGAVDVTVGIFLIIAAARRNAGEAKGLGDAAYTFAEARYRRLVVR